MIGVRLGFLVLGCFAVGSKKGDGSTVCGGERGSDLIVLKGIDDEKIEERVGAANSQTWGVNTFVRR